MRHMHHDNGSETGGSRWKWAVLAFLAVAGFFLWTEHEAHLLGVLPFLLVLACPLMHLFHGHGGHRHGSRPAGQAGQSGTGAPS